MIKINQLQIRDWVQVGSPAPDGTMRYHIPMYVTALFDDMAYLDFPDNEGDYWEVRDEDIYGIPLTMDILEQNGFYEEGGYWKCFRGKEDWGITAAIIYDPTYKRLRVENLHKWVEVVGKVEHLHSLQQAIRYAGIEKEVQL